MRALALIVALLAPTLAVAETNEPASQQQAGEATDDAPEDEAPPPPPSRQEVNTAARVALAAPPIPFCHVTTTCLRRVQLPFCGHVDPDRCPVFAAACAKRPQPLCPDEQVEDSEPPSWLWKIPRIGSLAIWMILALVVAALGWIIVLVLRNANWSRERALEAEEAPVLGDAGGAAEAARRAIETDVDRLLTAARASIAAGRTQEAVDLVYAALLRHLESLGHIAVERWLTNGDYLRALAAHPTLRDQLRPLLREIERLQFGTTTPPTETVQALFGHVLGMTGRALGVVLALVTACSLMSCNGLRRSSQAFDDSPNGSAAVRRFLEARGIHAARRIQPLTEPALDDVIVLLPDAPVDEEEWLKLMEWVKKGGILVTADDRIHLSPVPVTRWQHGADGATATIEPQFRDLYGTPSLWLPGEAKLEVGQGATSYMMRGNAPYLASWTHEKGGVYVFADDRLFTNAALATEDDAQALLVWARYVTRAYEGTPHRLQFVDGETAASHQATSASAVARSKLAPFTLQLLLLLGLFFIHRGAQFGAPRDPRETARRTFVEHVRALGRLYARARASRYAFARYASWALDELRVDRRGRSSGQLAEEISQRSGQPLDAVRATLEEAQAARDALAQGDVTRTLDARAESHAKSLSEWVQKLGDRR